MKVFNGIEWGALEFADEFAGNRAIILVDNIKVYILNLEGNGK